MANSNTQSQISIWKSELFWFLIFTLIVSVVTIFKMEKANNTMQNSHQLILNNDSLAKMNLRESYISILNSCMSDSLMSDRQRERVAKGIQKISEDLNEKSFEDKTTGLLEMEFTKIQNEYEVLNLWCALLTVVFLIFSFFSIFKTSEMSRQGEEALSQLRETAIQAKEKSASIDEQVLKAEDRINKKENELVDKVNTQITSIKEDLSSKEKQLKTLEEKIHKEISSIEKIEAKKEEAVKLIDDKINAEETKLIDKIDKAISLQANTYTESLSKQIVKIREDLGFVQNILDHLQLGAPAINEASDSDAQTETYDSDVEELEAEIEEEGELEEDTGEPDTLIHNNS